MYEGGWEAKTDDQLISRIKLKMKEFDSNYVESLMKGGQGKNKVYWSESNIWKMKQEILFRNK